MSNDPINNPSHYTSGGIETIDFIESKDLGYHLGNVVKYISRWKHKGGVEDLKKARWYLDRFIKLTDPDDAVQIVEEALKAPVPFPVLTPLTIPEQHGPIDIAPAQPYWHHGSSDCFDPKLKVGEW
jgi:hypothetical protein